MMSSCKGTEEEGKCFPVERFVWPIEPQQHKKRFVCKVNRYRNESEWNITTTVLAYCGYISLIFTSTDPYLSFNDLQTAVDISIFILDPEGEVLVKSEGVQRYFFMDMCGMWVCLLKIHTISTSELLKIVQSDKTYKLVCEFERRFEFLTSSSSNERMECSRELYDYLGTLGPKALYLLAPMPNLHLSDVTLISVEKTQFPSHKIVLSSRSPKFAEILDMNPQNKKIEINDVKPEVMKEMLEFIYTGKAPNMDYDDMAKDLLVAADCYKMDKLKALAESNLASKLSIDNAVDILIFGETNSADRLVQESCMFITVNSGRVKKTESWRQMVQSKPGLMDRIMDSVALIMAEIMETRSRNPIGS